MESVVPSPVETVEPNIPHVPREQAARRLLELFYPVHYAVGMKVEDTLRSSEVLNRQQAIILWLLRSEGEDGERMRRKYIENVMSSWYDITSSSISKAIRALARPPLDMVSIAEHPESGREKLVRLTPRGRDFINQMVENGKALCAWFLGEYSPREVDYCLYIYTKTNALFDVVAQQQTGAIGYTPAISTYRHPLSATLVDTGYGFADIPRVPEQFGSMMQLDIFFPIHYKAGNRVEKVLRSGVELSHQQVVILWIIHAEGQQRQSMRRKYIEKALQDWFEITSSSVSKAIRSMAQAPLNLVTLKEHPESGREKVVQLSEKGQRFVAQMMQNGTDFLQHVVERLSDDEIDMLLHIFTRTSEIFEDFPGPFRAAQPVLPARV